MTVFTKLTVENYKSISFGEVYFLDGIYKVIGDNQDTTYISNGAGKSSMLQAIMLGLYNKDFTGAPLDSLSNRFTGKPYCITVNFTALIEGKPADIAVVNPAGASRMRLLIDGVVKATGAVAVVPYVERILGMGYATFKMTHFITSSTITNLTQNLSQPSLFNDILHIVELQALDKKLLTASKTIGDMISGAKEKVKLLEQHNKLSDFKNKYDVITLMSEHDKLTESFNQLEFQYYDISSGITNSLNTATAEVTKLQQLIDHTRNTLRQGVCGTCGSILTDRDTLESLNRSLEEYSKIKESKTIDLNKLTEDLKILNSRYQSNRDEINQAITSIARDLNIANEMITIANIEPIDPNVYNELADLEEQNLFIISARKEIKKGDVIKSVLDQFFGIISAKISEYSELIKLDHFDISICNDKLGMAIILEQSGISVPAESLSNGEKTRLSLLILLSMLDAMKIVSDSETNLVVLDEASSSFDKSGITELSNLFSHLKHLGQSIFIITHGSEMDEVVYDYELLVTKVLGTSTTQVTEL